MAKELQEWEGFWLSTVEAEASIVSAFWLRSSRGLEEDKVQATRALWREGRRTGGLCEEGQCDWREVRTESKGGGVSAVTAARSRGFLHVIHTAVRMLGVTLEGLSGVMLW